MFGGRCRIIPSIVRRSATVEVWISRNMRVSRSPANWSDYCLGQFLRGTCLAVARYQPADAVPEAKVASAGEPNDEDIDRMAEEAFLAVVEHGPKVQVRYTFSSCMTLAWAAMNVVARM